MQSSEGTQVGRARRAALTVAMAAIVLTGLVAVTGASPPSGVTPSLLARGTYEGFKVRTDPHGDLDFKAKAKGSVDVVVRRHDYAVGSHTGWHSHRARCSSPSRRASSPTASRDDRRAPRTSPASARGSSTMAAGTSSANDSGAPATDVSVILAPETQSFRGELDAPGAALRVLNACAIGCRVHGRARRQPPAGSARRWRSPARPRATGRG